MGQASLTLTGYHSTRGVDVGSEISGECCCAEAVSGAVMEQSPSRRRCFGSYRGRANAVTSGMSSALRSRAPLGLAAALLLAVLVAPNQAGARPGTHPSAISTFDTRASSVAFAYRRGILSGGGFNHLSYNANFTNTTGVLSAQFGLHYINFKGSSTEAGSHGVAGGAVALFNIPATRRYDNGVPIVGVAPYVGIVPTAIINGEQSFLTLPAVLGLAFPMSPGDFITLTPWFETGLSIDLDTVIKPATLGSQDICNIVDCTPFMNPDPNNPPSTEQEVNFNAQTVTEIVAQGVDVELSVNAPMRFGLDVGFHAGDALDFTLYGGMATLGSVFKNTKVGFVGASLVWRWDDIVPAVLPPERRLLRENCDDIEARFRTCPASRSWLKPEQVEAERKEAEKARLKEAPKAAPPAAAPPPKSAPPPAPSGPTPVPVTPTGASPPAAAPPPATPSPAAAPPPAAPAPAAPAQAPLPPADFPR